MPNRVKIQIVPLGDWLGHSAGEQHYGEAEALAMVERANKLVSESGNPLQIDYEHASLDPPATGAPAAGWMHSFTLENDGIYAEVEWTPKAKAFIKDGEYKYISPVICSGLSDPVTGAEVPIELFNAALTNQPFMHDKIKQVVASAVKAAGYTNYFTNTKQITISNNKGGSMLPEEIVPAMAGAIGMPATTTPEELENILKAVKQFMTALPGAPPGGAPVDAGGMETMMTATRTFIANAKVNEKIVTDIAAELKVEADKILPTIKANATLAANTDDTTKRLKEIESQLAEKNIEELITANSNRIPPAEREGYKAFAKQHGIEAAKFAIEKLPAIAGPAPKIVNEPTKDATYLKFAKDCGLSDEDVKKYTRKQEVN